MIGDTASISLLTGLPGSGKSLRIIQAIRYLMDKGAHVYVCNIDGISVPGTTPWADPHKWQDLPAGSILFVDEAQHFFPARRGGDPVETIKAMSTIRHDGVRLVLATQQPNYLDTYLRGLVGYHEHLLRQSGKQKTFIFRNSQIIEEVRSPLPRIKKLYDYEVWKQPTECFKFYKSAEVHTMKYQMPALVKKALMILPVVALLAGGAWYAVYRDTMFAKKADAAPANKTAPWGRRWRALRLRVQQLVPRSTAQRTTSVSLCHWSPMCLGRHLPTWIALWCPIPMCIAWQLRTPVDVSLSKIRAL
ncbi:zonular occludens toxin domain-containing protein [Xanthomonas citri]|uniref:zonular occludens toxin domain-containing protein n=1 Tax=Xanthomonas citri TaxID=346 RepID=UPI000A514087|nr:zonular occludens toxin domain-containing protein [Xanthomonas citri]